MRSWAGVFYLLEIFGASLHLIFLRGGDEKVPIKRTEPAYAASISTHFFIRTALLCQQLNFVLQINFKSIMK